MDGMNLIYNKETGEWEEYKEPYTTIEIATEEAFEKLMEAIEKQKKKKPEMKAMDGLEAEVASSLCCPNCGESVVNYWNKRINPPHCMMCGQALDWGSEEAE